MFVKQSVGARRNKYLQRIDRLFPLLKAAVILLFIMMVCFQLLLQVDGIRMMLVSAEREEGTAVQ